MSECRLTPKQILEIMPQVAPFRFVDEILEVTETTISGRYKFKTDEWFYQGHFPGKPVTPGVILLEAMCQVGVVSQGIYLFALEGGNIEEASKWTTFFVDGETEFYKPVLPGDEVTIKGERIFWRRNKLRAQVEMFNSNGERVARAVVSGLGVKNG